MRSWRLGNVFEMIVIARSATRAVAIQLDCFVVPQSGTPRNDRIRRHALSRPGTIATLVGRTAVVASRHLHEAQRLGTAYFRREVPQDRQLFHHSEEMRPLAAPAHRGLLLSIK